MDLAVGAKEIRVLMEHTDKKGQPRIKFPLHLSAHSGGVW